MHVFIILGVGFEGVAALLPVVRILPAVALLQMVQKDIRFVVADLVVGTAFYSARDWLREAALFVDVHVEQRFIVH